MPTTDPTAALRLEQARERVAAQGFPREESRRVGLRVGLEPEYFIVVADAEGAPRARMPLRARPGEPGVLDLIDELAASDARVLPRDPASAGAPQYMLQNGGRLTFEPGAQIEHSTLPHASAALALADVEEIAGLLTNTLAARGAQLACLGRDPWFDVQDVPQQLEASRYQAMADYFDRRSPAGRTMMRFTASCQVNLDLGLDTVTRERWWLANGISPLLTATFACSPDQERVCSRALAWQTLDPTRTGFPPALLRSGPGTPGSSASDPGQDWAEAALAADVLLFQDPGGEAHAGEPGFRFEDWIEKGHSRFGWPTFDDLDYHLTTLFFEVRPRGFFEFRAADALPPLWRAAPVVLLSGLVYDDEARAGALAVMEGEFSQLDTLWRSAARVGLADEVLARWASKIWPLALEGARRLPAGFLRDEDLKTATSFLQRFTFQGLAPSDELREMHRRGPSFALDWSSGADRKARA